MVVNQWAALEPTFTSSTGDRFRAALHPSTSPTLSLILYIAAKVVVTAILLVAITSKLSNGFACNFFGLPGTGKSITAEAIALAISL